MIVLAAAVERGSVQNIRVLGALKFLDHGEADHKLIAIDPEGPFSSVHSLEELMVKKPGALDIVKNWFQGYEKPGKMVFKGFALKEETIDMIEMTHQCWKKKH